MIFQWWFLPYLVKQTKNHLLNKQNPKPSKKYNQKHTSEKTSPPRLLRSRFFCLFKWAPGGVEILTGEQFDDSPSGSFGKVPTLEVSPSITISGIFSPSHFEKYVNVKLDHGTTGKKGWKSPAFPKKSWSQGTGIPISSFQFLLLEPPDFGSPSTPSWEGFLKKPGRCKGVATRTDGCCFFLNL